MPGTLNSPWRRRKPPPGAAGINPEHPLARGLVFATVLAEGTGGATDLVTGTVATPSGTAIWSPTPLGIGVTGGTSSGWHSFGDRASWRSGTSDVTLMAFANPISEANARGLIAKRQSSTPFAQVGLFANVNSSGSTSAGHFEGAITDSGGSRVIAGSTGTPVDGKYHQYVFIGQPAFSTASLYFDGLAVAAGQTVSGSVNYTGTDALDVAGYSGTTGSNCTVTYAYYWLRALSAREIAWLFEEPFAFLQQPRRATYYVPASTTFQSAWAAQSSRVLIGGVL